MGDKMEKKIVDKWPYAYFFILTLAVFAGFVFSGKMLFGSDTVEAGIFFRSFYSEFVRTFHRIPLWDPFIFGGLPFVDAMHGDTFYPLAILQFIIPLHKALGYKLVITVFLAGVFTYLFLRKMGMNRGAAVFGGTAYMLSGFLVSLVYAGHDGRMYVTSLLPFLLYTMEHGFQRRRVLSWWPFGLAFGLLILANHPQFAYFAMWCVGAFFILRIVYLFKEEKHAGKPVVSVAGFILSLASGLCLALISILPTQDYVRNYSPRAEEGRGYEYAASWALHAEEVFSQLVPGFAGYSTLSNHPPLSTEQTYWGKNYFKINSESAGLMVIILALAGLFVYRDRHSYFFLGLAAFSLLYGLGSSGLIFKAFYNFVPFVSKFRAPSTIMFLFCFSMTFLAARMVDEFGKAKKASHLRNLSIGLIVFAALYLLKALLLAGAGMGVMNLYTSIFYPGIEPGQLSNLQANLPSITAGLFLGSFYLLAVALLIRGYLRKKIPANSVVLFFIVLVVLDSWIVNDKKFIRTVDHERYFAPTPAVAYLERQPKPFRALAVGQVLPNQDFLAQFGIEQATGYHGNQLRWYDNFIGGNKLSNLGRPAVLALTNTEYILAHQEMKSPILENVSSTSDGIQIYRNKELLPRARIVRDFEVIANPDSALMRLLQPDFDYAKRIIIDHPPGIILSPMGDLSSDSISFLPASPDRIRILTSLNSPGLLALQVNWYPFWKAFESKVEIPIYRADYTFMAVEIPAGKHEIEFRLENPLYKLGKAVSLVSWLILFAGLIAGFVVRRFQKTVVTNS
jgi:hypothetical protein